MTYEDFIATATLAAMSVKQPTQPKRIVGGIPIDVYTSAELRIARSVHLNASAEEVFSLLSDHTRLPEYMPMTMTVEVDRTQSTRPDAAGTRRTCNIEGIGELHERITALRPGRSYGYSILPDNPLGFENHLAIVDVLPTDTGSRVTWSMYFDHKDLAATHAAMDEMLTGVMDNLSAKFSN